MNYRQRLLTHLSEYKRTHLGIEGPGLWRGRPYHHILPRRYALRNLFDEALPAASAFLEANPGKRHIYFHHLNSSQAFAFNLFYPFFDGGEESAAALLRALGNDVPLKSWEPEAVPIVNEGTNVDVTWTTGNGAQTFCEVKVSEAEFGKAPNDARHRAKLTTVYGPQLAGCLKPVLLEPTKFFGAYQFNRNVWHMARRPGSRLAFLLPRANARLWSSLAALLDGVLPGTRNSISVHAIEDVIECLTQDRRSPETTRVYAEKLRQKYLIPNAGQVV